MVKFINKARVVSESWVDDPMLGRVSQEIAILTRIQHHNIVKVSTGSSLADTPWPWHYVACEGHNVPSGAGGV